MTALINNERAVRVRLHVPWTGAWWADVDLETAPDLDASVTLSLPGLELRGTLVESGTHALERRVRVVGGAGGWSRLLPARAYHNDAQVRARTVLEDAAREAGEELGDIIPRRAQLGVDWVRAAGPASRTLELASSGAAWWVAYDGRTHIGTRATGPADPAAYEVLDVEARERVVVLALEDLAAVGIGSVLSSDRLDEPQTVRELVVELEADQARVRAWCAGVDGSRGRLADAFRAVVRQVVDGPIYAPRLYRVVQMSGQRVQLQAVDREEGLPDISPASMWPGMAGLHASLTPGANVLVEFISGSPARPIITHFVGKDGSSWAPVELLAQASTVKLEGTGAGSIKAGAGADKTPAWASSVRTELEAIQTTLASATAPPGGGAVVYGVPYIPPTLDTELGGTKFVCE